MTTDDGKHYSEDTVGILLAINDLKKDIERLEGKIKELEAGTKIYMTRAEFEYRFSPVEKLTYGSVAVILVAFLVGVVALVFVKP